MASKSGVPHLPGTDVLDLQKYRSIKRMKEIIGNEPDFYIMGEDERLGIGDTLDPTEPDYLTHHDRMVKATWAVKKRHRQELIDHILEERDK